MGSKRKKHGAKVNTFAQKKRDRKERVSFHKNKFF